MLLNLKEEIEFQQALDDITLDGINKADAEKIKLNVARSLDVVEFIRKLRAQRSQLPAMLEAMGDLFDDFSQETRDKMREEGARLGLIGPHDTDSVIRETMKDQRHLALLVLGLGGKPKIESIEEARRFKVALESTAWMGSYGPVLARAAMDFEEQYVVTRMHPSAIRAVRDTDLAFWPSSCPKPLKRPMMVQADRTKGDGYLFHNFHTLLWVPGPERTQSLMLQGDQGIIDTTTCLSWSDDSKEAIKVVLGAKIEEAVNERGAIHFEIILQWLVKLALFFEAESTSGRRMTTCDPRIATLPNGRPAPKGQSYTVRYLRISDEALTKPQREAGGDRPPPPHADNLVSREVMVRAFLRRQVCGKGGQDRKVVYIAPHLSHRYVSPEKEVRVL